MFAFIDWYINFLTAALLLVKEFTAKQYEDVLDAVCLAVSAKLGCENGFSSIPEDPSRDNRGLKMQMVFGRND